MTDRPVTIVVSDLHVGGGPADPGDDHVYHGDQFRRFVEEAADSDDGRAGRVELFINGDFLEFAQVRPDLYTLGSADHWCSEAESSAKLDAILEGHPDIFAALRRFGERGNLVTIAAGNHDVDLYWADVQRKIRAAAGEVNFETGRDVCERYGGRLLIGHGHMYDPANSFRKWDDPFLLRKAWLGEDELRLEMCPGTLFMVKFVNDLEKRYPFSDNLKPFQSLARLLLKEDKWGLAVAALSFLTFVDEHPVNTLSVEDKMLMGIAGASRHILDGLANDDEGELLARLTKVYRERIDAAATPAQVSALLTTEEAVTGFIKELLVRGTSREEWEEVFDLPGVATLSASRADTDGAPGGSGNTLAIIRAAMAKDKEDLRGKAELLLAEQGVEVVVFGHTHQPDAWRGPFGDSDGGYFNPGSWTRYVDIKDMPALKLDDLRDEKDFPYQLNYVLIRERPGGSLRADMKCFEQASGEKFSPRPPQN